MKTKRQRAMTRIRRAITVALEWEVEAAFAGGGNPDYVDYKVYRAQKARDTLDRIILEELDNADC